MFTTIQNLHHSIRTVYGDSELTFSGQQWTGGLGWLIRIQAARARAERRHGQRQEQQRDTFNSERLGMQRWLGTINN
jgi:hypothetical protein